MSNREFYRYLVHTRDQLTADERPVFDEYYFGQRKNPLHAFVISLFFGDVGIDRIAIGQIWVGIVKLLTLGGLGIWTLIDYFLIGTAARTRNMRVIQDFMAIRSGVLRDGE